MDHAPGFLAIVEDARSRIRETSCEEILARLGRDDVELPDFELRDFELRDFELVDVREDREWDAGRMKGARHLGRGVLERDVEQAIPDKDREIVLYCGGGFRSALAADNLQKMGYRNVRSLAGGWRRWNELGGPIERSASASKHP